ncbi:short-chain dehydrogenase [Aphanothece hegewaldii CCALA 016]|uniref:Short-chain dehydrogenase n=1 Tax=Aphanothece hegewaldii CCALA 016 TaxID=2107694 RepID=A0A2T1LXY1_9CHRO|nr:SDR family oxidoreductase [Aphanothece hegewaldii]PSF37242.1 short-chain dehydrogenase [Aphanothece hegewaldii CCALA 016]
MDVKSNQQRAIITGASSGIGKATALAFARAGIDLALVSRSIDKLELVALSARDLGVEAKAYAIDLADLTTVKENIARIDDDFGPINIIVNNAGMGYTNLLSDTSLSDWQAVLNLNLTSIFECVMGILPKMRQRKRGTIVNIASIAAQNAFAGWGAYCVSKAGLVSFSQVLAQEERENQIRVISVCPGSVNTPIWDTDTVQADFDRLMMLTPETVAQVILQAVLLPEEAVIETITLTSSAGTL